MVGADILMRRSVIGVPSDSKVSSYVLPLLSDAEQVMLDTSRLANLPSCRQTPSEETSAGIGRPSAFGRVLVGQQHAVDGQHVEILLGPAAIFAGEGDDMAVVGGIVERDGEIGAAFLAVEIGDDLAAEIAARDLQRAALAGHQRIEIDVGPGLLCRLLLRRGWHRQQQAASASTRKAVVMPASQSPAMPIRPSEFLSHAP